MFIKNEKVAADVLYIRTLPFEEKFSEATTRMMMGDRLYGSVGCPRRVSDDLVSRSWPARQARLILNRLVKCG